MQNQQHVIRVMSSQGDTEHKYDPSDPAQLAQAERIFNDLRSKSNLMYTLGADNKGVALHEFDPTQKEIIAHQPLVGG